MSITAFQMFFIFYKLFSLYTTVAPVTTVVLQPLGTSCTITWECVEILLQQTEHFLEYQIYKV